MEVQPTNAVLKTLIEGSTELNREKFRNLEKEMAGINHHLETLNGQTGKNTAHRTKVEAYWKLVAFFITTPSVAAVLGVVYSLTK